MSLLFLVIELSFCVYIATSQGYDAGDLDRILFYTNPTNDFKTDEPRPHSNGFIYYAGEDLSRVKYVHVYNSTTGEYSKTLNVTALMQDPYRETSAKLEDLVFLYYRRISFEPNIYLALDTVSQKLAWVYQTDSALFEPSPMYANGIGFLLQANFGTSEFLAMDMSTGDIIWKITSFVNSAFCSYTGGNEKCVEGPLVDANGYEVDLSGEWGMHKQPAYNNGTVYVNLQSTIVAMDAMQGLPIKWSQNFTQLHNVARYSPYAFGNMVFTITLKEYACEVTFSGWPYWNCTESPYEYYALSADTGEVLWSRDFVADVYPYYFWYHWYEIGQHPVYYESLKQLYVIVKYYMHLPNPYYQLYALQADTGDDVWSVQLSTNGDMSYRMLWDTYQHSLLFQQNGILYHVDTSTGLVRAIDAKEGNQIWQEPTGLRYSSGTIYNQMLYLSQQHISESTTAQKDNYFLGLLTQTDITYPSYGCPWTQNDVLMKQTGIILYNRICYNPANVSPSPPNKPQSKSNQLLGSFLGVIFSISLVVLI